jgi:hypothetical protein
VVINHCDLSSTKKSDWKSNEDSFVERQILYQIDLERSFSTVFKFLKKHKQKWPVLSGPPVIRVKVLHRASTSSLDTTMK